MRDNGVAKEKISAGTRGGKEDDVEERKLSAGHARIDWSIQSGCLVILRDHIPKPQICGCLLLFLMTCFPL